MLPDFFRMVEWGFCWIFCKKWWFGCGFKYGKRGLRVVNWWLVFLGTRGASPPSERQIQGSSPFGFVQGQNDDVKARATATAKTTADPYGMTNKKGKDNGNGNGKDNGNGNGNGNGKDNSRSLRDDKQELQRQRQRQLQ
jgi:hypothetical protein